MAHIRIIIAFAAALTFAALAGCAGTAGSGSASGSDASAHSTSSSSAASDSGSAAAPSYATPSPDDMPQADGVLPEAEWGDYFQILGEDAVAFGRRVQDEPPVAAYSCWQGEGGGEPIQITDPAVIRALFNALASVSLAGYAQEVTTDDHTSFSFEFADGSRYSFGFDAMTVQVREGDHWKFYAIQPNPDLEDFVQQARDCTMSQREQ